MYARGLELPEDLGGDSGIINKKVLDPDTVMVCEDTSERPGSLGYVENQPDKLPHESAARRIREGAFEGANNLALTAEDAVGMRDLTGFGAQQLSQKHDNITSRKRARIIDGAVTRLFESGSRMLNMKTNRGKDYELRVAYGTPKYSPDEQLKATTTFSILQDRGVPAAELIGLLSTIIPIENESKLLLGLNSMLKQKEEMAEKALMGRMAQPGQEDPNEDDPEDNTPDDSSEEVKTDNRDNRTK